MNNLIIKDVIVTEFKKSKKELREDDIMSFSELELAGLLISEMNGDEIKTFITKNSLKSTELKLKMSTVKSIIKNIKVSAVELLEYNVSLPGSIIKQIVYENKGIEVADSLKEMYFSSSSEYNIGNGTYYYTKYNSKTGFYFVLRDTDRSPRRGDKYESIKEDKEE